MTTVAVRSIMNRWTMRLAAALVAVLPGLIQPGLSQRSAPQYVALYAGTDAELTQYDVDTERGMLSKSASLTMPGAIQYAWPGVSHEYLYVAWSNPRQKSFGVSAVRTSHGKMEIAGTAPIAARPIHLSLDPSGAYILVAYNSPPMITVHPILPDGRVGEAIGQPESLNLGIYPHHVRAEPSGKAVILIARGNYAQGDRPDPGSLRMFHFDNGKLKTLSVTAPGDGNKFHPRDLEFYPGKPWVYVALEGENKLQVYEEKSDGSLSAEPLFTKESLADPTRAEGQQAGAIHLHPNGRFIYQANRNTGTEVVDGKRVFAGGENNIAVYSIDAASGEPRLIQSVDTRGISPRTFTLDPTGRLLVVANQLPMAVSDGGTLREVSASLALFRIQPDGKLEFVRTLETAPNLMWTAILLLP